MAAECNQLSDQQQEAVYARVPVVMSRPSSKFIVWNMCTYIRVFVIQIIENIHVLICLSFIVNELNLVLHLCLSIINEPN